MDLLIWTLVLALVGVLADWLAPMIVKARRPYGMGADIVLGPTNSSVFVDGIRYIDQPDKPVPVSVHVRVVHGAESAVSAMPSQRSRKRPV